ncbi:MAG: primase-helicase zinc-binding domain-containing protein [Christensenella sp.]
MSWDDVDNVLYDGTVIDIQKLVCPNCGGKIGYEFTDVPRAFSVYCKSCGHISRGTGGHTPNCVKFLGNHAILPSDY